MSNDIGPPVVGTSWDETAPAAADAHGNGVYEIQHLRVSTRIRLAKEHVTPAASSVGGEHKQGSAVFWIQEEEPTTRPDGTTALTSADLGRCWVDTTNRVAKVLAAIGTPNTWTPVGELALGLYEEGSEPDLGLYMKGNELYFKGADGTEKPVGGLLDEDAMTSDSATQVPSQQSVKAFVTSGTVTMSNKTLSSPILAGSLSGDAFLDENDMASDSAVKVASQQSIKAYVDNAIGQSAQATGTTDISNVSGGWADMADLSVTITTKGGNVLVSFTATIEATDDDDVVAQFRFDMDGTPYNTQQHWLQESFIGATSGRDSCLSMQWLFTSLAAGSHTFKVQWYDVSGNIAQDGTAFPRVLSVVELPS